MKTMSIRRKRRRNWAWERYTLADRYALFFAAYLPKRSELRNALAAYLRQTKEDHRGSTPRTE